MVSSFWPSRSTSALSQSLARQPCLISRHELRRILTEFLDSIVYSDLKFQHLAIRLWFLLHDLITFHSWPASQKQSWEITARSTWPHLWESSGRPRWLGGKEPACQCKETRRRGFSLWVGKIPWRRKLQPTPVLLPGGSHGQRSLAGCSPRGHTQSDMIERQSTRYSVAFECLHVVLPFSRCAVSSLWPQDPSRGRMRNTGCTLLCMPHRHHFCSSF